MRLGSLSGFGHVKRAMAEDGPDEIDVSALSSVEDRIERSLVPPHVTFEGHAVFENVDDAIVASQHFRNSVFRPGSHMRILLRNRSYRTDAWS